MQPPRRSSFSQRRRRRVRKKTHPFLFSPSSRTSSSPLFPLFPRSLHPQAEHTAAYLNFLSRLPPRRSPAVVPFTESNKKTKGGNFYFNHDGDDDAPCSASAAASTPLLPPPLPRHRGKATLVLDLDHTLVRSAALPAGAPLARGSEACAGPGGDRAPTRTAFARRPHLATFLRKAASLFEVVVFTAGSRAYAEPVLNALDPERKLFAWRLYRDACVRVPVAAANSSTRAPSSTRSPRSCLPSAPPPSSIFVVKDLKRLGRPLSRTLIVDNSPTCYAYQVSNGVPVSSWKGGHRDFGDLSGCGSAFSPWTSTDSCDDNSSNSSSSSSESDDTALIDLLPLLERAAVARDVRPLIEAAFPAAAAAAAAARAHPSLFACFENEEEEEEEQERKERSAFAAACAKAAAAEEEAAAAGATAAADASSDKSDATGVAPGTRTTAKSNLDLLLAAATESDSDDDDADGGEAAPMSSPPKKRGRECRFEDEAQERASSKALRLELFQQRPRAAAAAAVCC